jgi:hypothetical protein
LNSLNAQPAVRDYDGRPMTASTPASAAAHALLNDPAGTEAARGFALF